MVILSLVFALQAAAGHDWRPLPPEGREAVSRAVGNQLRDSESARYRWLPEDRNSVVYCGFVNGRNAYGGYAGFVPFMVLISHGSRRAPPLYSASGAIVSTSNREDINYGIAERMCAQAGYNLTTIPEE